MSGAADDIVSARADFVKQVRCVRGETPDRSSEGVRAADADGLVHVAHGDCMGISQKLVDMADSARWSKKVFSRPCIQS